MQVAIVFVKLTSESAGDYVAHLISRAVALESIDGDTCCFVYYEVVIVVGGFVYANHGNRIVQLSDRANFKSSESSYIVNADLRNIFDRQELNIFLKHTCKTYNIVFAIGRNCSMCGKYSNTLALSVGNSLGSSIECNVRNHEILVHVFLSNIGYCSYSRINRVN